MAYKDPDYQKKYRSLHKDLIDKYKPRANFLRKKRRHELGINKRYNRDGPYIYERNGKEYGDGWIEIRKAIYERDNWTCQECHTKCHGNGTKDKIQCHHVDYDVKNNDFNNLITLCASCHSKTNSKDRERWIAHFKRKELNYVRYF